MATSSETVSLDEKVDTTIRVLTMNAWGIALWWPFESKDRRVRMPAIAEALRNGNYDIVTLQEVWSVDDYEMIRTKVAKVLPDAFYFHSGMVGSGVCIFTRGTIYSTMMHRYSLNGYPHHVHRGDWFGGKVVGLARIKLNGLKIDVYTTHLHAEYDKDRDLYLSHRVLQAYEMSQFFNGTSNGDIAIVTGDLNLEPTDFGYQLITSSTCLQDAQQMANQRVEPALQEFGGTCDVPSNCYTNTSTLQRWPHGKRLDYIFYRTNKRFEVTTSECKTVLGRIPTSPSINYSDHEAVAAELKVVSSDRNPPLNSPKFPDQAIGLIEAGIASSISNRRFYNIALGVLFAIFLLTIDIEVQVEKPAFTLAALSARFFLTLAIGFCFVHGVIGLKMEQKALEGAKAGMLILKRADQ